MYFLAKRNPYNQNLKVIGVSRAQRLLPLSFDYKDYGWRENTRTLGVCFPGNFENQTL